MYLKFTEKAIFYQQGRFLYKDFSNKLGVNDG